MSETPIGDKVAADLAQFPVGLTARGRAIFAGGNALPVDGDDTLDLPVAPATSADDEVEQDAGSVTPVAEPASPTKETADDPAAVDRETRSE